ncbi:MAG: hypothetical protein QXE80_03520 [Pyrobaculum sp.]
MNPSMLLPPFVENEKCQLQKTQLIYNTPAGVFKQQQPAAAHPCNYSSIPQTAQMFPLSAAAKQHDATKFGKIEMNKKGARSKDYAGKTDTQGFDYTLLA